MHNWCVRRERIKACSRHEGEGKLLGIEMKERSGFGMGSRQKCALGAN